MSSPFGTSLRRNPEDSRGLLERIDAQVRERLEEAAEMMCLDLMVQLRRHQGRPLPEQKSDKDRQEFRALVRELLLYLREQFWDGLAEAERQQAREAEALAGSEEVARLLALQASLARRLPDYWQRLEGSRVAFAEQRLQALSPKRRLRDRLLGRD